ncbi:MAG: MBL fold metallo-hydrolase [Lautropia sp.]
MVRPATLLHPQREPAPPRPAATILLLRDAADGVEVLMTRRSPSASFAPGAFVFPGGALDVADGSPRAVELSTPRATQTQAFRAFAVAAIREAFEELGVLLARDAGDAFVDPDRVARLAAARDQDFLAMIGREGLKLAVDEVRFFAHWITDRDLPRRFDARFLMARIPPGQQAVADDREQFEPVWVSPAQALARHEAGDFPMIFPTIRTLRRMAQSRTAAELLARCGDETPAWMSSPRAGRVRNEVVRFAEEETAFGELELVSPDGQIVHDLDWQSERVVPLLRHLGRLTAPNPGRMTGPGTNTYVIGDAASGYVVIDPGPPIDAHIERLHAHVGDRLSLILCTHSHPDHSPGAFMLQRRLADAGVAVRIHGLASAPTAAEHSRFVPDEPIADDARFAAGGVTIRAVHTPGHAANHVCFFVEEDRLLFSGDHILNGSTTIVGPPDGDMRDYLASLARLDTLDAAFILPAHGHVIGSPSRAIAELTRHRLKRESKVLDAIRRLPGEGLEQLVTLAYDDTPTALHGIAQRSLLAHALKLVADGSVVADGNGWRA